MYILSCRAGETRKISVHSKGQASDVQSEIIMCIYCVVGLGKPGRSVSIPMARQESMFTRMKVLPSPHHAEVLRLILVVVILYPVLPRAAQLHGKMLNPLPGATSENIHAGPRAERPKTSGRDW